MLDPLPQESWSRRHANHLLQRAGFGGTPDEREALFRLGEDEGVAAAVDSLLETTEDWSHIPWPDWALSETDPNGFTTGFNQGVRRRIFNDWYFQNLKHGQPLAAKLLKFFVDHFAIDSPTIGQYYRFIGLFRYLETLRRHAAGNVAGEDAPFEGDERLVGAGHYGNFKTLVNHVSWSIAMIRTLDLYQSTANSINENFGRELLELFTVGLGSLFTDDNDEYTEDDVVAAAKAYTGRKVYNFRYDTGVNQAANQGLPPASTFQNNNQQDRTAKTILGQTQTPGGSNIVNGDDVLDVIFASIRCAKHLSWKLWRYFASPNPSKALVEALALRFRDTHDYEIRPFLRDLFLSQEFYDESVMSVQIKDSGDLFIGMLNQLELPLPPEDAIEDAVQQLGYEINFPPSIAGWPEPEGEGNTWLAAGSLVFRLNLPSIWTHRNYDVFTNNRVRNSIRNSDFPEIDWDRIAPKSLRSAQNFPLLLQALTQRFLPDRELRKSQIRTLYDRYIEVSEQLGSLEGVRELTRLILALPEYQIQ